MTGMTANPAANKDCAGAGKESRKPGTVLVLMVDRIYKAAAEINKTVTGKVNLWMAVCEGGEKSVEKIEKFARHKILEYAGLEG